MLARVLAVAPLSVSVCLSQVSFLTKPLNKWSGFGVEGYIELSYTVLQGNSGIYKNKGTAL